MFLRTNNGVRALQLVQSIICAFMFAGMMTITPPALAADCGTQYGITANDLTMVEIKPDGTPVIDAGALFTNAMTGNKKALDVLHRCAVNNDTEAMAFLGMYYSFKDDAQSLKWYLRADAGGNDQGCNLGKKYELGKGVRQNDAEAAKWYLKSAEHGDRGCQYNLGNMYLDGRGVPKSMNEAIRWWRKAAEQGNADAQMNLGVAYEHGDGVPQDKSEAAHFYQLACKNSKPKACEAAASLRDVANDEPIKGVSTKKEKPPLWFMILFLGVPLAAIGGIIYWIRRRFMGRRRGALPAEDKVETSKTV